jgi:hypothetical protein
LEALLTEMLPEVNMLPQRQLAGSADTMLYLEITSYAIELWNLDGDELVAHVKPPNRSRSTAIDPVDGTITIITMAWSASTSR